MTRAELERIENDVNAGRGGSGVVAKDTIALIAEVRRWQSMVDDQYDCTHWKYIEKALVEWEGETNEAVGTR